MDRANPTALTLALGQLGLNHPDGETLIVSANTETILGREAVWAIWSNLRAWPSWSPVHRAASWVGTARWVVGARFDQELDLGFPLGLVTHRVIVNLAEPARQIGWSHDQIGVASCAVWRFADLPRGGTAVSLAEVWHGAPMVALGAMVAAEWHRLASDRVARLIGQAATFARPNPDS